MRCRPNPISNLKPAKSLHVRAGAHKLQRRVGAAYAATNQSLAWTGAEFPAARVDALDKALSAELVAIGKLLAEQRTQDIWDELALQRLAALEKAFGAFKRSALDTLGMRSTGLSTASSFIDSMQVTYRKLDEPISALSASQRESADGRVNASAAAAVTKGMGIAIGAGVALLLSGLAGWWCSRLIVAPLQAARQVAAAVARGDLRLRSTDASRDETGRMLTALDQVSAQLGEPVVEVRGAAQQVELASAEIAQGNADLSGRTEQQAARLQESASSIKQLSAGVRLNAQRAARAGELGRGFAVVAGEVRPLAQHSDGAAKESCSLISTSVETTEAGTAKVQAAGKTMQRIVDGIGRATTVMSEIASACQQQAQEVLQMDSAVAGLDRSTQQNAALVEQASAATESLKDQSQRLVQWLDRFDTA